MQTFQQLSYQSLFDVILFQGILVGFCTVAPPRVFFPQVLGMSDTDWNSSPGSHLVSHMHVMMVPHLFSLH